MEQAILVKIWFIKYNQKPLTICNCSKKYGGPNCEYKIKDDYCRENYFLNANFSKTCLLDQINNSNFSKKDCIKNHICSQQKLEGISNNVSSGSEKLTSKLCKLSCSIFCSEICVYRKVNSCIILE